MKKKTIYGAIVWFITTLFVIYSFTLSTAGGVFADAIKTSFHITNVGFSCALGSFVIGFAGMQIPAGYLLDRYNARFVVSGAVLLLVLGNIAISLSNNIFAFSLANFIQGIGASFDFVAAGILISQWFPAKMFPILTGLIESLACIVAGVMHYYFAVISSTHSWHELYLYLSMFGTVLLILILLLVKTPSDHRFATKLSLVKSLKIVCKNGQIWLCAIAAATSFGVLLSYAEQWYLRVQKYYSVEHLQTALIGGMFFFGIAIGSPLLGWLSNRVHSRKMILHLSLVLGNMILLLALYLPHFAMASLIPIKIVSFLTGFFLSGSMLFITMVSEMSSKSTRGVALSVTNTVVFLYNSFMLVIPYLSITSISHEFFTYLWVLPFCVMISILLLYFINETYSEEGELSH